MGFRGALSMGSVGRLKVGMGRINGYVEGGQNWAWRVGKVGLDRLVKGSQGCAWWVGLASRQVWVRGVE